MPPRSPFPFLSSPSDARTATLQGLLIAAIVITGLYLGRDVLLPLALAILLSFVLTPPLLMLRRIKVPRALAVGIVVAVAFSLILALGWVMSREVTNFAAQLPTYRTALSDKITSLRDSWSGSPVFDKAGAVLSDLQNQLLAPDNAAPAPGVGTSAEHPSDKPIRVEIYKPDPTPLELFQSIAGTLLPPLAIAGIVLLFLVFILLQREDLRDRFIRLVGASDLQRATTTLNDAANRLSKYFLRQILLASTYAVYITLALWAIGIPSPIVWGVLAGLMRFVPFIGPYIAALPPLLLAAVVDDGWTTMLLTGALYLVSELIMGQVIEPMVFGHGTGVSPLAVIVSTIFWTWLWGPLGLLLATPITVCLAVLGRHVDGLQFFDVLLGDEPALSPEERFYQRALSGDAAEATYHAELGLKEEQTLATYLDQVALGALKLAERDARRGMLDQTQAEQVSGTVKEMLDNLADFEPRRWFAKFRRKKEDGGAAEDQERGLASLEAVENGEDDAPLPVIERAELAPGWAVEEPVLSIGGRSPLDEAAAAMLAEVLTKRGLEAKALPPETLSAGHITSLDKTKAKLVSLSYLGLGASGPAQIRYLVRRLKRILPEGTLILVCLFDDDTTSETARSELEAAGADAYATSLTEAADLCLAAARGTLGEKPAVAVAAVKPAAPPAPGPARVA